MTGLDSIAPGLLERFRSAGARIAWREVPVLRASTGRRPTKPGRVRIAHLHDEEARIEERPDGVWVVESGPVGALVLLLEIDRRGAIARLRAIPAGRLPGFDQGAVEGSWTARASPSDGALPLNDLVELARYALA